MKWEKGFVRLFGINATLTKLDCSRSGTIARPRTMMTDVTAHPPRQHQQEILDPRLPILQLLHLILEFLHR